MEQVHGDNIEYLMTEGLAIHGRSSARRPIFNPPEPNRAADQGRQEVHDHGVRRPNSSSIIDDLQGADGPARSELRGTPKNRRETTPDRGSPNQGATGLVWLSLLLPDARLHLPRLPDDAAGTRPVRRRDPRQLRQEPGQAARQVEAADHLRGGRRPGERQERAPGDRRVPQEPREVPEAGRADPQGGPAQRPAGHRQDPAGPRRGRRGGGAVLLDLGVRVHPDVRRRRGQPGPRHVQDGQGEQPVHPVHRRDRRRRSRPRRGARRRP